MKSKFVNKIVFNNNKYYQHTYKNRSPYWFVLKVEKDQDRFDVHYIDRFGNRNTLTTTKHYLQKEVEILDISKVGHLAYDFIKGVFK